MPFPMPGRHGIVPYVVPLVNGGQIMDHPVFAPGRVAVVTGAAMGIGLAACRRFAQLGMRVCLADLPSDDLTHATDVVSALARGRGDVMAVPTDVGDADGIRALQDRVQECFGGVDLLMNNAVTRIGGGIWGDLADWRRALEVNLWGVIHGVRAFVPAMIEGGAPACVVNVGSKQGITNPPGNTVYNLAKAALKSYTESLQHELRNTEGARVTAHLLVPGWTTTGKKTHQPGAWLPEQVIDEMIAAIGRDDFYIICPDNEVTPAMDRKRILWAAGDINENRPPLSRWHGGYDDAFEAFEP